MELKFWATMGKRQAKKRRGSRSRGFERTTAEDKGTRSASSVLL
jgi:hypothetical protein